MSEDVSPGLALTGVVTWFVTCFPASPTHERPGMTVHITDEMMTLETGNRVVATARFSEHAAANGNGGVDRLDLPATRRSRR